jgi:hypothetical protein
MGEQQLKCASLAMREPVAQSVEHLTFNQRVPGSNPGGLTIVFAMVFGVLGPMQKRRAND